MKQRYDSYKPSGIDWIGDIPSHWDLRRMRYLCDIITGDKDTVNRVDDGLYPFYVRSPQIERINSYSFDGEAVLMAGDGVGAGKVLHYATGKFDFHQRVYNFHNFRDIKGKLLYLYLKSLFKYKIEEGGAKNTVDSVRQPWLKDFPVCIPPLAEQEAIAAWLDEKCEEIDAAIAKVDREIELIDELKQSEISRVVTRGLNPDAPLRPSGIDWIGDIPEHWAIAPIKSLGSLNKGLTFTKADLVDEGECAISYGQIHSKLNDKVGIRHELIRFIPGKICLNNNSSLTRKGDFIFADTSEDLDGCGNAIYNDTTNLIYGGYHTIILHSNTENNKYFGYLFLTDAWRSQIRACVSGVKVYSITQSILKNCSIIVPPIIEQQAIADYLDKKCAEIDGLKAKLTKKRETLTELRQSIISEVVTGKRKVI